MQSFQAIAHHQPNHQYSPFHNSLEYSLRHLYSISSAQIFLSETLGWDATASTNIKYGTIDVYQEVVYIHIPKKCPKGKPIRGISRFVSKNEFVKILITKCWGKADPYKLEMSKWDEFTVMGNSGEFYELQLYPTTITCTCHAFSGVSKAFEEDRKAKDYLIGHPQMLGQIPDKHILAIWKYLGVSDRHSYRFAYQERISKLQELPF